MPKDWKARCRKVRLRDKSSCRRCGGTPWTWVPEAENLGHPGATDHIIPRRIASRRACHAMNNLALLCLECHAYKTQVVEPALFRGDVQTFERFLAVIGDPIPSPSTISRAYRRIRELTA